MRTKAKESINRNDVNPLCAAQIGKIVNDLRTNMVNVLLRYSVMAAALQFN